MQEIQINYTLEEVKARIKDKYRLIYSTGGCRREGDTSLMTYKFVVSGYSVETTSYASTHTALTTDNFLLSITLYESSYGLMTFDDYFGLHVGSFETVKDVLSQLPTSTQEELIALSWLNHNPAPLLEKLSRVFNATSSVIEGYTKDINLAEEMLVNAHHSMKKQPKAMFTSSWLRLDHWKPLLSRMPWLKSCLEKEEK